MGTGSLAQPGLPRERGRRAISKSLVSFQGLFLGLLVLFASTVAIPSFLGSSCCSTPLIEHTHQPLCQMLRPSGTMGRALGNLGTAMLLYHPVGTSGTYG